MTKFYCDRCKEEITDFNERNVLDNFHNNSIFVLCNTCYDGFVENFMHAFDEVIYNQEVKDE